MAFQTPSIVPALIYTPLVIKARTLDDSMPVEPNYSKDTEINIVAITEDLLKGRFSCRYFLPRTVPQTTIEDIIDIARFSPSGNNIQPWEKVYCVSGKRLAGMTEEILAAFQTDAGGYTAQYEYYPPLDSMPLVYAERRQGFGAALGQTLGIDRTDIAGRMKAAGRNYQFYNAPIALIFTINKGLRQGSWLDVGYFLQSISIAARSRGLETVSQESVAQYQTIIRKHIPVGDDEIIAVGMAVGYPDMELATQYELPQERREVSDIIQFCT